MNEFAKEHDIQIEIEIDGAIYVTMGPASLDLTTRAETETEVNTEIVGIRPPIAGTIVKLCKTKGDTVVRGEQIAILEAMKMYNVITAPESGIVVRTLVEEGEHCSSHSPIIEISVCHR